MKISSRFRPLGVVVVAGLALAASVGIGSAATDAHEAGTPPVNTAPPSISGSPAPGQSLSASTGSWSGDAPMSFAFRWERCDAAGGACSAVSGATGQTYGVGSADEGKTLRVEVTATNGAGTGTQLSAATSVVSGGAPVSTAAPHVSGSLAIGSTITVSSGSWSGAQPITVSYQWSRCDLDGGRCAPIANAVGAGYRIADADASHRLVVVVAAKNAEGTSQVVATAGNVGASGRPASTAAPKVSGSLAVGATLSVSAGSWSGAQPITLSYQWERCDAAGGHCAWISGATAAAYRTAAADAGHRLIVSVTAHNAAGSTQVVVTAGNVGGGPAATTQPKVTGSLVVGATLVASAGSWSGAQPIAISYQWARCDLDGGRCVPIPGATGGTYRVAAGDTGHRIVVVVAARNSVGTSSVTATAGNIGGAPIAGVPVSSIALPDRLVIDHVKFAPQPVRSRAPITARFHVADLRGKSVTGALVYALGLPYGWTRNLAERPTGADGWVTLTIQPQARMPLRKAALVVFVRARKPGDSLIAGVSTRRLVQVRIRAR
jgi:predicted actin-binding protein